MGEWKKKQLGELSDIGSSKRIFYNEYVPVGIPFYRSKEVIEKHNGKTISTELQISIEKYSDIKEKFGVPVEGDMLLTSVGTLGIPYIVQKDETFYFKDGNLTWFRNFNNFLLNHFLYYWIVSPVGKGELDMVSIGSTQPALTIRGLKGIVINIPPLPEQKAIASVLSSLDDKIDLLHRQNKTLEAMAETLFRQWFVEAAGEEVELGSVIETTSGGTPLRKKMEYYENGIHCWVKSKELTGSFIIETEEKITDKALKSSAAKLLPANSILIAMYGATVGEYSIISKEMTCNQAICALKSNKQYPYTFLFILIKTMKEELINMAVGSAQQNISQLLIKQMPIPSPNKKILEFHANTEATFEKINRNINQIRILEKLRDTLLPKLMSGEVRVEYKH